MLILAIDTSTDEASVALAEDEAILGELSWRAAGNHSRHLTPAIEHLFSLAGLRPASLSTVVSAIGPGSFSGIRVGLSHAMGMAMGLSIPLVGVSTLDIVGLQASAGNSSVWAVLDAGRGQVFAAHYVGEDDRWRRDSEYLLVTPPELEALVGNGDLLAGSAAERMAAVRGNGAMTGPWAPRRAGFLAELGRRYLAASGGDQLHTVQPIYLRRSAAEEKRASSRQE